MTPSRLIPLCFLGTLCLAQAAAQSAPALHPPAPTPQPDALIQTPPLTAIPPLVALSAQTTRAPVFHFSPDVAAELAALGKDPRQMTIHSNSCYAMHTYVITPGDMTSKPPQPSSSATCTESATVQMKAATLPGRR